MTWLAWVLVCGGIGIAYALGAWAGYVAGYRRGRFDEKFEGVIK